MATMTTGHLMMALQQACAHSSLVDHVDIQLIDADVLSVRVGLAREATFINVFYNLATDKTAFTLVEGNQRIYGVDNAKMGWHEHPFGDFVQHIPCEPVQFDEFLANVEKHYQS